MLEYGLPGVYGLPGIIIIALCIYIKRLWKKDKTKDEYYRELLKQKDETINNNNKTYNEDITLLYKTLMEAYKDVTNKRS